MSIRLTLTLVLLLAACSAPPTSEQPEIRAEPGESAPAEQQPTEVSSPRVPLTARWQVVEGQPMAGARLAIDLVLTRQGRWTMPLKVDVAVPDGATLLSGEVSQTVTADAPSKALAFVLQLERVPTADLVAVVHSASEGAGLHAEPRYTFGRTPPPEPELKRGPRLKVGGKDAGRPVLVE